MLGEISLSVSHGTAVLTRAADGLKARGIGPCLGVPKVLVPAVNALTAVPLW